MRLEYEGLDKAEAILTPGARFYQDPAGFAMERYAYYVCFKCKKVRNSLLQYFLIHGFVILGCVFFSSKFAKGLFFCYPKVCYLRFARCYFSRFAKGLFFPVLLKVCYSSFTKLLFL